MSILIPCNYLCHITGVVPKESGGLLVRANELRGKQILCSKFILSQSENLARNACLDKSLNFLG